MVLNVFLAILVLSIIVIVHEFGHFIIAKANGITVVEFSIGFGPKLIHFRKGETEYCIKALPFGGACTMLGDEFLEMSVIQSEEDNDEELTDEEKEAKKKQKTIAVKEIRLRPGIESNDLNTKANNAIKFLKKGDKVKVELRFRGRELGHKDIGKEVMLKFIEIVKEFGEPVKAPAFEGNNMVVIIDPKKTNK